MELRIKREKVCAACPSLLFCIDLNLWDRGKLKKITARDIYLESGPQRPQAVRTVCSYTVVYLVHSQMHNNAS